MERRNFILLSLASAGAGAGLIIPTRESTS